MNITYIRVSGHDATGAERFQWHTSTQAAADRIAATLRAKGLDVRFETVTKKAA